MKNIKIRKTDDYEKLVALFAENEMDYDGDEPVPTNLVTCWEMTDEDGKLQGGIVLAKRQGEYISDGLAVNPSFRKGGYGTMLMNILIDEVRNLGGKRIYIVARAPEVFRKIGYVTIGRDEAPSFFECFSCDQYQKTCFPEVMRYDI